MGTSALVCSGLAHGSGTCHFVFRKAAQCAPVDALIALADQLRHAGSQRFTGRPVTVSGCFPWFTERRFGRTG